MARLKGPFQSSTSNAAWAAPSPSSWEAGWMKKRASPLLPYQVFPFSQNSMVGISMGLNIGITPVFDGSAAGAAQCRTSGRGW